MYFHLFQVHSWQNAAIYIKCNMGYGSVSAFLVNVGLVGIGI